MLDPSLLAELGAVGKSLDLEFFFLGVLDLFDFLDPFDLTDLLDPFDF